MIHTTHVCPAFDELSTAAEEIERHIQEVLQGNLCSVLYVPPPNDSLAFCLGVFVGALVILRTNTPDIVEKNEYRSLLLDALVITFLLNDAKQPESTREMLRMLQRSCFAVS